MSLFKKKSEEVPEEVPVVEETQVEETPVQEARVAEEPVAEAVETPVEQSEPEGITYIEKERDPEPESESEDEPEDDDGDGYMSRAEKKARKQAAKQKKKAKKKKGKKGAEEIDESALEDVDTVIKRSDAEAHRYIRYEIPGKFRQTLQVTGVELKRMSKGSGFIMSFIMGLAIYLLLCVPLIYSKVAMIFIMLGINNAFTHGANICMGFCLSMMPFFAAYVCASKMAHSIPMEFKERTIFLHFGLPVSKGSYYMGKFIAHYLSVLLFIIAGYAFSFLVAFDHYGYDFDAMYLLKSFALAALAAFALCSVIFAKSASKRKGSTIKGFLYLFMALPLLYIIITTALSVINDNVLGIPFMDDFLDYIDLIVIYLPFCGFDMALQYLGGTGISLTGMLDNASMSGVAMLNMFGFEKSFLDAKFEYLVAVYFLWGLIYILRGKRAFNRREL